MSSLRVCSSCGDVLVMRRRKSDGHQFYGCASFPRCKHSEQIEVWAENDGLDRDAIIETAYEARTATIRLQQRARREDDKLALRCTAAMLVLLDYVIRWKHADDPEIWDALDYMNMAMKKAEEDDGGQEQEELEL